jgi:hypothetical protein
MKNGKNLNISTLANRRFLRRSIDDNISDTNVNNNSNSNSNNNNNNNNNNNKINNKYLSLDKIYYIIHIWIFMCYIIDIDIRQIKIDF